MKPEVLTEIRVEVTHKVIYTMAIEDIQHPDDDGYILELVKDRLVDDYGIRYIDDAEIEIEHL